MMNSKINEIDRLRKLKDFEGAIRICDEMISDDASCYAAFWKRCNIFRALGKFSEAFADLERLLEIRPNDPTAYVQRAEWRLELGEDQLALTDIELVLKTKETYYLDTANFYKAIALLNLGDKAAANAVCLKLPADFRYHIVTPYWGGVISGGELYEMTKNV